MDGTGQRCEARRGCGWYWPARRGKARVWNRGTTQQRAHRAALQERCKQETQQRAHRAALQERCKQLSVKEGRRRRGAGHPPACPSGFLKRRVFSRSNCRYDAKASDANRTPENGHQSATSTSTAPVLPQCTGSSILAAALNVSTCARVGGAAGCLRAALSIANGVGH